MALRCLFYFKNDLIGISVPYKLFVIVLYLFQINFIFFIDIVRVLCNRMKTHRNVKGGSQQFRYVAKT